jgi:hypothetical protein
VRFEVYSNALSNGVLPPLPFDQMEGKCLLLDHPSGGSNDFTCPWPVGATEVCEKYDGASWVNITDGDCHGKPTSPPRTTAYAAGGGSVLLLLLLLVAAWRWRRSRAAQQQTALSPLLGEEQQQQQQQQQLGGGARSSSSSSSRTPSLR